MAATWTHPALGRFRFENDEWKKTVAVPAFDVFTYRPPYATTREPRGRYELAFEVDDERETPPAEAVALVSGVLANQRELAAAVTAALWEDFSGRGPRSGMWWHGGLEAVGEDMEDSGLPPLLGPDALHAWMRLSRIVSRGTGPRYPVPLVEFRFEAAFEEEHGVGVLTDGKVVRGTGYAWDVGLFKFHRPDR